MNSYPLIDKIHSPEDLRALSLKEREALPTELRRFLIDKVTKNGGHLASNLGAVELTVALHLVFDSPRDRFIFDVGHQSYVHKILTGRAPLFDSLRKPGGLSGFPTRRESEHDPFGTGHSSTSLSAALGFSEADALSGSDAYTVCVVGDGAMTGGMIHEALNNCKKSLRTVIVLNDNEMSISRNIGLFSRHLSRIRSSYGYGKTKRRTKRILRRIPLVGKPLSHLISAFKGWLRRRVYAHNYFEDIGISYLGPVDGHNLAALENVLREARAREGTVLVHVLTTKGKGMAEAENDPTAFHGVAPETAASAASSFHGVASEALMELAEKDSSVCAVTAAMGEGTGLSAFLEKYPDRFFDVGIAEEHALTFSAGLAAGGMKPYFAVYSTFLQRAYDNLLHDVALQGLGVRILVDRAGLASADGATHHGIFDVACASGIPGVTVWSPATYGSLREMLARSAEFSSPLIIRYPNSAEDEAVRRAFYPTEDYASFGVRASGDGEADVILITYGRLAAEALASADILRAEGIRVCVLLLECLAPYEETAKKVLQLLGEKAPIVFAEEGALRGGAGMLLHHALLGEDSGFASRPYRVLAIEDFASPTSPTSLLSYCGIDREAIACAARRLVKGG